MKLLKTSFFSALQVLVKMLAGFIVLKAVAYFSGPVGVAMLGQFQNFFTLAISVSGGALTIAITKYTAEYIKDGKSCINLYASTFLMFVVLSTIVSTSTIIFSNHISLYLLKSADYLYVIVMFGCLILPIVLNLILLAILNGQHKIKLFLKLNVLQSLIILVSALGLISTFGLAGALISLALAPALVCLISVYLIRNEVWYRQTITEIDFLRIVFKKNEVSKLTVFLIISLASALAGPICQTIIREYLAYNNSWRIAGLWQGVSRISEAYLILITASFGIYILPKLSGIRDRKLLHLELLNIYKLAIPASVVLALLVYIIRDTIVRMLFTAEFSEMRDLFGWQLCGDVIKVASWILGYTLISQSKLKIFLLSELFFSVSYVGLSIFFIDNKGVEGAFIAYFANYCAYLIFMIYIVFSGTKNQNSLIK